MTRKDYIAIANAIRSTNDRIRASFQNRLYANGGTREEDQLRGVRRAAAALADALADDNPRFDAALFLKSCGYAGEVRATQPVNLQVDRHQQGEILDN